MTINNLQSALELWDNGFNIIPIKSDPITPTPKNPAEDFRNYKTPFGKWQQYQNKRETREVVKKWYEDRPYLNIGIITNGLLVVDADTDEGVQWCEDNFSVDLLNFGVSGDTTAGGLERFDWSVSSDVSGVVIILGGNDLLRGIPPDHSFENLRKMIIKAKKRGLPTLLVGIRASANFGSDYKIKFDKMYKLLQTEFDIFYYENFFSAISHKDVSLFLSFMQQDGIHPNAAGIKKIVADFYPTFKEFVEHAFLIN
mgnify:CR=1 FL=1